MKFRFHGDQSSCRHVHLHTIPSQICSTRTLTDQHYMEFQFHRCYCSQWHVESTNNHPPKLVPHGLQQSFATWNSNFMTIGWDVDISSTSQFHSQTSPSWTSIDPRYTEFHSHDHHFDKQHVLTPSHFSLKLVPHGHEWTFTTWNFTYTHNYSPHQHILIT